MILTTASKLAHPLTVPIATNICFASHALQRGWDSELTFNNPGRKMTLGITDESSERERK